MMTKAFLEPMQTYRPFELNLNHPKSLAQLSCPYYGVYLTILPNLVVFQIGFLKNTL